jgi:hypothetical protein
MAHVFESCQFHRWLHFFHTYVLSFSWTRCPSPSTTWGLESEDLTWAKADDILQQPYRHVCLTKPT